MSDHTIIIIWVVKIFFVEFFCVSFPPLLNISASVRSLPFLSFFVPIFAWNVLLLSPVFLKRSVVFPILLFSSISLHWSLRKAFFSLLAILWNSAFKWIQMDKIKIVREFKSCVNDFRLNFYSRTLRLQSCNGCELMELCVWWWHQSFPLNCSGWHQLFCTFYLKKCPHSLEPSALMQRRGRNLKP